MVELKKDALKDVTTLSKTAPETLVKTKEVLNQAVADLYVAHIALHQVHWYMRGRGFMVWHSEIEEEVGEFRNVEESLERVLEIYRYLITLFQKALDVTDEEGDDVTNDIFVGAKADLEKTVWMLAAELGQAPGL